MKHISLSLLTLVTASCMYAADPTSMQRFKYPVKSQLIEKCEDITKELMYAEIDRYSKTEMEERIKQAREVFDESERTRFTEECRSFEFTIERIFREDARDPLACLVIDAVKEYERRPENYWSIKSKWMENEDGTRSLHCSVKVNPQEIMEICEVRKCWLKGNRS